MSVASLAPELAESTWDDVISQLDGIAPVPDADPTPSPAPRAPAPAPTERAERAAERDDTGTDAGAETPASDPQTPTDAPQSDARATYPKWWKGTEPEWQEARRESNRAANRERDRAERLAQENAEIKERLAFIESQLTVRDGSYAELAAQAYGDPARADLLLNADRQRGTDTYLTQKQQRDAEAARAATAAAVATESARTAEQQADAARLTLFSENLAIAAEYAAERSVVGLSPGDKMRAIFAKPENAPLLRVSQSSADPEAAEAATTELYARALTAWRADVDAAASAKAAATRGEDPTEPGRRTAHGAAGGSGAPLDQWTPEAADAELTAYFQDQDRRAGGHYRAPRGARVNAS